MIEIFTSRLILCSFNSKDITKQYLSWLNNRDLMQFSNQRFTNHTNMTALKYLKSFEDTSNLFIAIKEKNNNRMIGTMTAYISKFHSTADLGILIGDKNFQSSGYGQEAWKALIDYLFYKKDIRKITAGCMELNRSMLALMKKSGMKMEAAKKDQEKYKDNYVNLVFFCKFVDEHIKG